MVFNYMSNRDKNNLFNLFYDIMYVYHHISY